MKLSKTQQELYDAMKRGVVCHFMSGLNCYYFRCDSMKRCTTTARALLKTGLIEKFDENKYNADHSLRIKP